MDGDQRSHLGYEPHPALHALRSLADGLARSVGPHCEIVLHDLRHPDRSLIHIAGDVTHRALGAPVTNIVLESLRVAGDDASDIFNYKAETSDGRMLRSSTIFIRDGERIVGALCINIDVSPFRALIDSLDAATRFEVNQLEPIERFRSTVADVLDDLVATAFAETGLTRSSKLSAEERLRLVDCLEQHGVFLIKGAVDRIASELAISKFTIYSQLQQVRAQRHLANAGVSREAS